MDILEDKTSFSRPGLASSLSSCKTGSWMGLDDSLYKEKEGALYRYILEEIEKPLFEYVLERTYGNQLKAARILGINRNTMRAKIRKLGIDPHKWKIQ